MGEKRKRACTRQGIGLMFVWRLALARARHVQNYPWQVFSTGAEEPIAWCRSTRWPHCARGSVRGDWLMGCRNGRHRVCQSRAHPHELAPGKDTDRAFGVRAEAEDRRSDSSVPVNLPCSDAEALPLRGGHGAVPPLRPSGSIAGSLGGIPEAMGIERMAVARRPDPNCRPAGPALFTRLAAGGRTGRKPPAPWRRTSRSGRRPYRSPCRSSPGSPRGMRPA